MCLNSSTLKIWLLFRQNQKRRDLLKRSHKLFTAGTNYYNKFHVATQDLLLIIIADANPPQLDTTGKAIKIN